MMILLEESVILYGRYLRYYLMKAGKALHVWDEMPQEKQEAMMKQAYHGEDYLTASHFG